MAVIAMCAGPHPSVNHFQGRVGCGADKDVPAVVTQGSGPRDSCAKSFLAGERIDHGDGPRIGRQVGQSDLRFICLGGAGNEAVWNSAAIRFWGSVGCAGAGITIPAGYSGEGVPFGLTFIARSCMEPQLIQIASAFEAATTARRVPTCLGIETSRASRSGDGMCANPDGDGASCAQVV